MRLETVSYSWGCAWASGISAQVASSKSAAVRGRSSGPRGQDQEYVRVRQATFLKLYCVHVARHAAQNVALCQVSQQLIQLELENSASQVRPARAGHSLMSVSELKDSQL